MATQFPMHRIVILFLGMALFTCKKSDRPVFERPVISLRTLGGWCIANDSLTIDRSNTLYIKYNGCSDEIGYTNRMETNGTDYQELMEILGTGDFRKLNINESGLAYDGNASIITVRDRTWQHSVSLESETSEAAQQQNALAVRLFSKLRGIQDKLSEANVSE